MLDLSKLHHLPWSKTNNPNGWIELTTFCQLKCPGCYRLCNQGNEAIHKPFEEVTADIDRFIAERNVQFISFAGGEPMMYPQLIEAIKYTKSKGIGAGIVTNGILLTKDKIIELQEAGMTKCNVHIDKHQGWDDVKGFREKICDLFREAKCIKFGFITTIAAETYDDITELIKLCKENIDIVDSLVMTTYRDMDGVCENDELSSPVTEEVIDFLREQFKCEPCAYLNRIVSKDKPGWLFMYPIFKGKEIIGYFTPEDYVKYWERMYLEGKLSSPNISTLDDGTKYLNVQLIVAPTKINGVWDVCDGCPDAMYYKGKLITSCLLELIKNGEKIEL